MSDPYKTYQSDADSSNVLPVLAGTSDIPATIGRYQIERVLGEGGFGRVFLAYDDQLNRPVAIKVPRRDRLSRPQDAEAYLVEARVLASMDHPNIVPVYDVGCTPEGLCYVVSKLIQGSDLTSRIQKSRLAPLQAVTVVATVAEALQYAHRKGLVHRDIKPGNILLDATGTSYVADFGLALKEENFGSRIELAGTPAYMSPEQARGEGHRIDGRSDIFSLGIVFYELLVGRRPFQGNSMLELLDQISTVEARPLRQIDETIHKELERICFKALSKRAAERYMTAKDMADDLRHFLAESSNEQKWPGSGSSPGFQVPASQPSANPDATPVAAGSTASVSTTGHLIKIVPKGLRSFDAHDADFFRELLPGPRDRNWLPDSIRFWKTQIEETDSDNTFSVGLIYGPSGCGKSSLMKAGLLPCLSKDVIAVYIEATADETESRLLSAFRKRWPGMTVNLSLKEALAALRRGQGMSTGTKVVIVVDQFEQWLHANREEQGGELVQALRQCDGARVQCIVMVRDDFWMAATRFMRELEVRLIEGQNSAAVDLFPIRHAEKVLAAFGRAFGVLQDRSSGFSKEQKQFLEQSVAGLAQDGKVICVRLALFAEMMKGKAWTPASLREAGGTAGVGVTFLEGTFSSATAPPEHRYHQKAARAILSALLPESGTDIKGHMRSYAELLDASGYANRPKDFDEVIRVLDSEIRLITPTDPEGTDEDLPSAETRTGQKYFQLTHDYLVPSLRDWLTRKQKETRRGRAELLLQDRASVWNGRRENRQLPSMIQHLSIRRLVPTKTWTQPQMQMMRQANRYHGVRSLVCGLVLCVFLMIGWNVRHQLRERERANYASALVKRLVDAESAQVGQIILELEPYRNWTDSLLRQESEQFAIGSRQKLNTSLALLPVDPSHLDYLYERLLDANPQESILVRDALIPFKEEILPKLRAVVEQAEKEQTVLPAACALAIYAPDDNQLWTKVAEPVANRLVSVPPVYLATWMDALSSIKEKLLVPLSTIYRDGTRRESERSVATDILARYASGNLDVLIDLVMDADEKQFTVIFPKLRDLGDRVRSTFEEALGKDLTKSVTDEERETLAKRQANSAIALLKMNESRNVWPLLKHSPDPRLRSYLIHRIGRFGVDVKVITARLAEESDVTIQRALVLSLAAFPKQVWNAAEKVALENKLLDLYRTSADHGLRAASEWLLRQWKLGLQLKAIDDEWVADKLRRESRFNEITSELSNEHGHPKPNWYVNGLGQTMVVIPGPSVFMMGSAKDEPGRDPDEMFPHEKRIGRTFAIGSKEVTKSQFREFQMALCKKVSVFNIDQFSRTDDSPQMAVDWYDAAWYCNWISEIEGIPKDQWCYEPNVDGEYGPGMKPSVDYLKRNGYRLPTNAEWEFACRANTVTGRYYGQCVELLPEYGWFVNIADNRAWPTGTLKPNDFGLFDMYGNALEWCDDPSSDKIGDLDDVGHDATVQNNEPRMLRGGSFLILAMVFRSGCSFYYSPSDQQNLIGFRVARTLKSVKSPVTQNP